MLDEEVPTCCMSDSKLGPTSYVTCPRCGAQLSDPKLGTRIECPSCHAIYSVKTPMQASDGAPHCHYCGAELDDEALREQTRVVGRRGPVHFWVCSACRHPRRHPH
jgi:DNA-directed RNA polymerase subunit RPC12/RpoP